MHAAPRPDLPVLTPDALKGVDGFAIGGPTRCVKSGMTGLSLSQNVQIRTSIRPDLGILRQDRRPLGIWKSGGNARYAVQCCFDRAWRS